jgi:putative acetyltransferase
METLETDRLILRPWRENDLEDFHEYCVDPEVGPNAGWKPHESMEESRRILGSFVNCDEAKDAERAKGRGTRHRSERNRQSDRLARPVCQTGP